MFYKIMYSMLSKINKKSNDIYETWLGTKIKYTWKKEKSTPRLHLIPLVKSSHEYGKAMLSCRTFCSTVYIMKMYYYYCKIILRTRALEYYII